MRRITILGFLGVLLTALAGTAWGFALFDPPVRNGDPDFPMVYTIYYDLDEPSIAGDHEFDLVKAAFENWEDQPEGVDLPIIEGDPAPQCGIAANGIRTVSFQDCQDLCGPGVLGVTYLLRQALGDGFWTTGTDTLFRALVESDFVYCKYWNWDDSNDWPPCSNGFCTEGVGTHEIGHMLGLGHSGIGAATMFASIAPCDSTRKSLHYDDKRGTRVMYRERVRLEVAEHDNFNGAFGVTNCANLGVSGAGAWNNQPGNWGTGFIWPAGGSNSIYESSFAFGATNSPVSDNFRTDTTDPEDDDFIQLSSLQLMDLPGGSQTSFGVWDDSKNDQPPYGIKTLFRGYTFPSAPDDDYVILLYWLVNESGSTINNLRAGIFTDFDFNNSYATNSVDYDADIGLGYVTDPGTTEEVGITVLNPEGVVTFRALLATGETYSDANKTAWMQSGFTQTNINDDDIACLIATGLFDLAPGDTALAAFAFVGGGDHNDLRANALAAQTKFASLTLDPMVSGVEDNATAGSRLSLAQNRPNPFGASTHIAFGLDRPTEVSLIVTEPSGRLVRRLAGGMLQKGHYSYVWDGRDERGQPVSSGVYFYSLRTPDGQTSRKMVYLR